MKLREPRKWALMLAPAVFLAGAAIASAAFSSGAPAAVSATSQISSATAAEREQFLGQYCSACHNDKTRTAGMSVQSLHAADVGADTTTWEKILSRVNLGEMPPKGMRRPPREQLTDFTRWLESSLDQHAAANVDAGRATLRRMNRVEYANAVRDLLAVDVDISSQLPADDSGYGFDNIADVLTVSPTLMDSYIAAAGKISRMATGSLAPKAFSTIYEVPKDAGFQRRGAPAFNERSSDLLPLDSRGGGAFMFNAPYDGDYVVKGYLNTNTLNDNDLRPENTVTARVPIKAGPRAIGMYFDKSMALDETQVKIYSGANFPGVVNGAYIPQEPPKPMKLTVTVDGVALKSFEVLSYDDGEHYFQANYPRDILQIVVDGPFDAKPLKDTPSRRKIFICQPSSARAEPACARTIISTLAAQAYRRPVTANDVNAVMKVYEQGRRTGDFDQGIQLAVQAILVSPQFLFMEERNAPGRAPGSVYALTDLELATRLSFFLWSSLPDRELVSVAQQGRLKNPTVLKQQVLRLLADPRAQALTTNFASQWLFLRNLQYVKPNMDLFPEFDSRLRSSMRTETELFFSSVVRENRPVLDFIKADYTYLNQALAEFYGVPGVYGSTFRRVKLDPKTNRGGLLGQASILTVTSYDNRTSVVLRGKWILDNLLSAPPPPPPPDVPALTDSAGGKAMTVRQMMELHRANPVCASCHNKMDPLGFALENFNAIGAWRDKDSGGAVDTSATLPDGTEFAGPSGLQDILLARKDQFVEAFTQRLMTYALARGVEAHDMAAVRKIRRDAAVNGYRMNDLILGIVQSIPFQMRSIPADTPANLIRTAQK